MITLQTINTIELSSLCNLACLYCVNRLMEKRGRRREVMSDEVFERALYWLRVLDEQGTQREVNLNGNGESTLDPKLAERAARVVGVLEGAQQVSFCTNGLLVTDELVKDLKEAGIRRVDVSVHSAYHARRAVEILARNKMSGVLSVGAIAQPHNWAGQLEPEHSIEVRLDKVCDPLVEGRGYVQSDGSVSPCCFDYHGLGTFGHVFDDDLLDKEIKPYELCLTCHQKIPEEILCARR